MSQKLSIKIKIADREYPMQTEQSMESRLRKAGKLLNEKIKQFQTEFGVQDRQDLLGMAAFDCMVELLSTRDQMNKAHNLIVNKITNLNELASSKL